MRKSLMVFLVFISLSAQAQTSENPGQNGTLLISGTPGASQTAEVDVLSAKTDANGQPIEGAIGDGSTHVDVSLNQPAQLAVGTYLITYSNSFLFAQVQSGKTTEIKLKRLSIGDSTQSEKSGFVAFTDLTNTSMQTRYLQMRFALTNPDFFSIICKGPIPEDVPFCKAWTSGNPQNLAGTAFQFNADGTTSEWEFSGAQDLGNLDLDICNVYSNSTCSGRTYDNHGLAPNDPYVKDTTPAKKSYFGSPGTDYIKTATGDVIGARAGQFISVLPGVYGVTVIDLQTNERVSRFGL